MKSHDNTCQSKPLINLDDISMRWDHHIVLDHINLQVDEGDFMLISGPNGGGKTTLLRIMLKLLKPTEGKVTYHFDGHNRIGYLPQKNMIDSMFPITVREVIASGLLATKPHSRTLQIRVNETLEAIGLSAKADDSIGQLSGGQLQRALLGRAIIANPTMLILDEPLSYIDKRFEQNLYSILEALSQHTTIVLVSHEITTLGDMANRRIYVDRQLHLFKPDQI